jgi:hypothetical protein
MGIAPSNAAISWPVVGPGSCIVAIQIIPFGGSAA